MRFAPLVAVLVACGPAATETTPGAPLDLPYNGKIERQGERDILYLWGDRYEIGYAEGALTCDRVGPMFKSYLLEYLVQDYSDYSYDLARLLVLGTTTFAPDDEAQIDGYFDGATEWCTEEQLTVESDMFPDGPHLLELDDLRFANAIADFGCSSFTVWGAASATGDTIHGRNFDWAIDPEGTFADNHMLKVFDSVDDGARYASVMVPGMLGCVSCVTDEGISLTMHNVSGLEPDSIIGISPRMLSARAALVATAGADDPVAAAEAVLEARPELVGNNLHLAMPMARGNGIGGVVFEVDGQASNADGQVTVRYPGEDTQEPRPDVTLAANHYAKRRIDLTDDDSNGRVATLAALIDAGPVAASDGRAMLEAVENGYDGITTHSIVYDTANAELQLFVAPDAETPALAAEPTTFDMTAVFGRLSELSGDGG